MKKLPLLTTIFAISTFSSVAIAAEPAAATPAKPAAEAKATAEYEGKTYSFATEAERDKWVAAREASLYHRLGGKAAINAAVDAFYVKVLADEKVNHFFDDVSMRKQHNKQKEFLSAAFGGPEPWTGKDMRVAHKDLDLKEEHFAAIAGHLQSTLKDLKVPEDLIKEVMAIAASTHDDVLNK